MSRLTHQIAALTKRLRPGEPTDRDIRDAVRTLHAGGVPENEDAAEMARMVLRAVEIIEAGRPKPPAEGEVLPPIVPM